MKIEKTFSFYTTDVMFPEIHASVLVPLWSFDANHIGKDDDRLLNVLIKDETDTIIGGTGGSTRYNWLFINYLFVAEEFRGLRLATQLIEVVEKEAKNRGCHSAWLHTFDFEARPFYEKLGFECFGTLPNHANGASLHFMRKTF